MAFLEPLQQQLWMYRGQLLCQQEGHCTGQQSRPRCQDCRQVLTQAYALRRPPERKHHSPQCTLIRQVPLLACAILRCAADALVAVKGLVGPGTLLMNERFTSIQPPGLMKMECL